MALVHPEAMPPRIFHGGRATGRTGAAGATAKSNGCTAKAEARFRREGDGRWKIFPPNGEGRNSLRVSRLADLDSTTKGTPNVPHCWEPSVAMDAVETGKGNRLEQLRPEQGLERPGNERSKGDREKPSGLANVPAMTRSSSRLIELVKRIKPRLDGVIAAGRRGARRAHTEEHEQHQCRAPRPSHSPEPSRSHHALATLVDNTLARGNRRRSLRLRCVGSIVDAHATDRCPENVPCRHSTFQEDQPKNARTPWRDQASHRKRSRKPTGLSGRRGFGPGARESIPSEPGDRIDRVRRLNSAAELENRFCNRNNFLASEINRALILAKVRCWLLRWKIHYGSIRSPSRAIPNPLVKS